MNILILGNGAREHALTYKAAQSDLVKKIYVAPGNAGTQREQKSENIALDILDFNQVTDFVRSKSIDLTIVGPEVPLSLGIVDHFQSQGLLCFGPNQKAAQLEGSKSFAKDFMQKYNIPTAQSQTFTRYDEAEAYIQSIEAPIVIKADGLCAGKGVVVALSKEQALATLEEMLTQRSFEEASDKVVIEEFLVGEEASFIILTDGKTIFPFATSQDHKARDDGDKGPNTGGMGAYSPAPMIDNQMHQTIIETIVAPTLHGLQQEAIDYQGFLYFGIMVTASGPKVLEYNCRLGDPEAQVLLMRLENDFIELLNASMSGDLSLMTPKWSAKHCLGVVMASQGYPSNPHTGEQINGLNDIPTSSEAKVFHAGTKIDNGSVVSSGGRVLTTVSLGQNILEAQKKSYDLMKKIKLPGSFYRSDIGHKAIERLKEHA